MFDLFKSFQSGQILIQSEQFLQIGPELTQTNKIMEGNSEAILVEFGVRRPREPRGEAFSSDHSNHSSGLARFCLERALIQRTAVYKFFGTIRFGYGDRTADLCRSGIPLNLHCSAHIVLPPDRLHITLSLPRPYMSDDKTEGAARPPNPKSESDPTAPSDPQNRVNTFLSALTERLAKESGTKTTFQAKTDSEPNDEDDKSKFVPPFHLGGVRAACYDQNGSPNNRT